MSGKQQKIQMQLAFMNEGEVKPDLSRKEGTEPRITKRTPESPPSSKPCMEEILADENLKEEIGRAHV